MKKLILILLILLLPAGGAAWWFLLREPPPGAEGSAEAKPPAFLDMPPFVVPVVRDRGVRKLVQIDLALELKGEASEAATQGLPRLTDAFVTELYGLLGRRQMEEHGYNLGIIKRHLQRAADRALGPDQVIAILVQGIALAPVR